MIALCGGTLGYLYGADPTWSFSWNSKILLVLIALLLVKNFMGGLRILKMINTVIRMETHAQQVAEHIKTFQEPPQQNKNQ